MLTCDYIMRDSVDYVDYFCKPLLQKNLQKQFSPLVVH